MADMDKNAIAQALKDLDWTSVPVRNREAIEQAIAALDCDDPNVLDNLHASARNVVAEPLARLCSHVDALRDAQIEAAAIAMHDVRRDLAKGVGDLSFDMAFDALPDEIKDVDRVLARAAILAASPVQQPAAALIDDARECLMDVVSHHDNTVAALSARRVAADRDSDRNTADYWRHEIEVARRMKAQAERALAAMAQPAPAPADERAALPSDGFFVYDPAGPHVEFYDTDAERDAAHRDAINEYRREAMHDQEWSTEVVGIVSGIVTHTTDELKVDEDSYDYEPRVVLSQARAASANETGATGAHSDEMRRVVYDIALKYCEFDKGTRGYNVLRYECDDDFFNFVHEAAVALSRSLAMATEAVALYQYRTRPDWKDQWSEWEECSAAAAADYIRVPRLHGWHYEARALGVIAATPQPPAQGDAREATLADRWINKLLKRLTGNGDVTISADDASFYANAIRTAFSTRAAGLTVEHTRELKNMSSDPRLFESEREAIRKAIFLLEGANQ